MRYILNQRDWLKGILLAVLTPVLTIIINSLNAGTLTFDWKLIGITALASLLAYITKNFFTDDVKTAENTMRIYKSIQEKKLKQAA
jgi:hypothetical protein